MKTKKMKKTIVLSVATILTIIAVGSATIAKNKTTTPELEARCAGCTITGQDVIDYLEGYGYTNIVPTQIGAPRAVACDFICDTEYSYDTYVTCSETAIIGHEDLPD